MAHLKTTLIITKINSRIYAVYDTPGNRTDQSPYRSELGGISMMLLILQCGVRYHGITQGSIHFGLDGKKAMEQASGTFPLYPEQRSCGMLVDIRKKITLLPIHDTFFGWRAIRSNDMGYNHTWGTSTISVTTWQIVFGK